MTQNQFMVNIIDQKNLINEDILNFKEKDYAKIIDVLSTIAKSIEIIPEIKFTGVEICEDEDRLNNRKRIISIKDSRIIMVTLKFKIIDSEGNVVVDEKGDEIRPKIDLYIPKLINGTFLLNDVKYYPMLQITDYKPLLKENQSLVKTLINKLELQLTSPKRGKKCCRISIFNRKDIPIWLILFAMYGPYEPIKRIFKTSEISYIDAEEFKKEDYDENNYHIVEAVKYFIIIKKKNKGELSFVTEVMLNSLEALFSTAAAKKTLESIMKRQGTTLDDHRTFIEFLGSYYATNVHKYYDKGSKINCSLSRFLDSISKSYLEVNDLLDLFLKEIGRINEHNMALERGDIELLEENKPNNLLNKRVRMSEYIIYKFTKKLSDNMHAVLNTNTRGDIKLGKILNIFKIDKNIILDNCPVNNLVHYYSSSNQMSAIAKCKASFASSSTSGDIISNELKMVPQSGVGRIDLITTPSGGSVGIVFSLSATRKNLFDSNGVVL